MKRLLKKATGAMANAYAPYSKFKVGSAVRGKSGRVYTGCNVENVSYGATICAERVAITHAVASGETEITHVALVNSSNRPCTPCGVCLQVIAEFGKNAEIVSADKNERRIEMFTLRDLLPHAFDKSYLK